MSNITGFNGYGVSLHIRLLRLDDHLVLILEGDAAKLGQLLMDLAVEWLAP